MINKIKKAVKMFKVKNRITNEITTVLAANCDEYGKAWFLIWNHDKWLWRPSDNYVPPNYQQKYRWVVVASRDFQNYPLLKKTLDEIKDQIDTIICGESRGADIFSHIYAKDNNIKIHSFPADWQQYGKATVFMQNIKMAEYCDKAIIFWNEVSPEIKDIIAKMQNMGKECIIIKYKEE